MGSQEVRTTGTQTHANKYFISRRLLEAGNPKKVAICKSVSAGDIVPVFWPRGVEPVLRQFYYR